MGAIAIGIVVFALGIFLLWVLVYASGVVRPKVTTDEGIEGAAGGERKALLVTGLVIVTGLTLTVYSIVDPMRQAQAKERQLDTSIHRAEDNFTTLCMGCHGEDGKGAVVPGSDPPRVAPQLNRDQFWAKDPDEAKKQYDFVFKTIQRGRPGTPMPAWGQTDGGTLNEEQISELTLMITNGDRAINGEPVWASVKELAEEKIAHGSPRPTDPAEALLANVPPEIRAGAELFSKNGCVACHAVQGDTKLVGPSLAGISQRGATREPGKSAEDYIKESVRQPSAYIVEGFPGPPSLMPPFSPAQVSDDDLNNLVQYLMSLK
jgi:mono/diheme cytochrome c family protein